MSNIIQFPGRSISPARLAIDPDQFDQTAADIITEVRQITTPQRLRMVLRSTIRPQPGDLLTGVLLAADRVFQTISAEDPDEPRSQIAKAMLTALRSVGAGREGHDRAEAAIAEQLGDTPDNWGIFVVTTIGAVIAIGDDRSTVLNPRHPSRYPSYTQH